jgi:hypothetical protein
MKVIKRSQVTEVIISRQVSHDLKLNGKTYTRYESTKVCMPHMDCEAIIPDKTTVKWCVYVEPRVVEYLSAKEIKTLKLEEIFGKLPLNARNGNA